VLNREATHTYLIVFWFDSTGARTHDLPHYHYNTDTVLKDRDEGCMISICVGTY